MPTRHNNHQIEDSNRRKFENLLPDSWVVRNKFPDYGVDQEVEIFEEMGASTGIIFNVQLRGTDDPKKEKEVVFKYEQLNYFNDLELPTLIIRYCRTTGNFYYKWHFSIKYLQNLKNEKTFTLKFEDHEKWDISDFKTIKQLKITLEKLRQIRRPEVISCISLNVINSLCSLEEKFTLDTVMEEIHELCPFIVTDTKGGLIIDIVATPKAIKLSFSELSSFDFEIDYTDSEKLRTELMYALVALINQLSIKHFSKDIALSLLDEEATAQDKSFALHACMCLISTPENLIELAKNNDLHNTSNFEYNIIMMKLLHEFRFSHGVKNWYKMWLLEALAHPSINGQSTTASILLYNLANNALQKGDYLQGIIHFNKARNISGNYKDRDYFWHELAGCLFLARRYKLSNQIYEATVTAQSSAQLIGNLADSQIFNGKFILAEKTCTLASDAYGKSAYSDEFYLKSMVCEWLSSCLSTPCDIQYNTATKIVHTLREEHLSDLDKLQEIWFSYNPLDPMVNFNIGNIAIKQNEYEKALPHFLISGFVCRNDIEAWRNSIACAFNINSALLQCVLRASFKCVGLKAYREFRNVIKEHDNHDGLLEEMDKIIRDLVSLKDTHNPNNGLTFRLNE